MEESAEEKQCVSVGTFKSSFIKQRYFEGVLHETTTAAAIPSPLNATWHKISIVSLWSVIHDLPG